MIRISFYVPGAEQRLVPAEKKFTLGAAIKLFAHLRIMRITLGILISLVAAISEVPKGISRQIYCETCHIMAKELVEKLDDLDGKGLGLLFLTIFIIEL